MNQNNFKMAKKKKSGKKRNAKRSSSSVSKSISVQKEAEQKPGDPQYMIQLSDPKMLRKDLLESLREIIIFMQGYEKFRQIQEEKVNLFTSLKSEVKELNGLIENKLRKYFPKGKLKAVTKDLEREEMEKEDKRMLSNAVEVVDAEPQPKAEKVVAPVQPYQEEKDPYSEINHLESQLKDIENQLRGLQ